MVYPINRDVLSLSRKSAPATKGDIQIGDDLLDTLKANAAGCVGMAANMIGIHKRIIAVNTGWFYLVMYNPSITKKQQPYEAEEGCLSLPGVRRTRRWDTIEVKWQDRDFQWHIQTFTGYVAQIIQHEIDHCDGILI